MSIKKRTWRDKEQLKSAKNYTVYFFDHMGNDRRLAAFPDKTASKELDRYVKKLVSLKKVNGSLGLEELKFLESLPESILGSLSAWGIVDLKRNGFGRALKDHIVDFEKAMKIKDNSPRHIRETLSYLNKCIGFCKWVFQADISTDGFNDWILDQREAGKSLSSLNHCIRAWKSFCNWLVNDKRLTENPLRGYPIFNENKDKRLKRRPLVMQELCRLIGATEASRAIVNGMNGESRALLYMTAALTGLRWGECYSLTRADLDIDGIPPSVTIQAAYAKNEETETLVLRPELAKRFKDYLAKHRLKPAEKLFVGMWLQKGADMIVADLKEAGVAVVTSEGRIDFHSLRYTFAKLLERAGVSLVTAQKLMRHSDPKLTANIYTQIMKDERNEAVASIPEIVPIALTKVGANQDGDCGGEVDEKSADLTGKKPVLPPKVIKFIDQFIDQGKLNFMVFPGTSGDSGGMRMAVGDGFEKQQKTPENGPFSALSGVGDSGTRSATRTQDLLIKSQLLYQLS